MAAQPKVSARLQMFSDREFLQIVSELADEEGWADAEEIAKRIFPSEMRTERRLNAVQAVSIRMSWMKRFGVIEQGGVKQWGLTEKGEAFARGKFSDALAKRIEGIAEDQLLELTNIVSSRLRSGDPVAVKMMRREWHYQELQLRPARRRRRR